MVVGELQTVLGVVILSSIFASPFVGVYLLYTVVWPKVSYYV